MAKILVEIIGKANTTGKKCEVRDNLIVLKKKTKDHPERTAEFDQTCILNREYGRIKKTYQPRLMLHAGAKKCISFKAKRGRLTEAQRGLDAEAITSLFDAEVAHKQGQVHTKIDVPMSLYIFLIIIMGLQFLNMLMNTGRVQLG